ncbi:hypothetical protein CEXT_290461 [Caerostris extrusa]|uniref:Uncharacterized protein n=1 Tax=Caerostris extrusa TaxID=172846 RepID=A0AAV4YDK5_CAEEX|nr:hypothetical protein CEXT_290461 [Caerostris extrusa]
MPMDRPPNNQQQRLIEPKNPTKDGGRRWLHLPRQTPGFRGTPAGAKRPQISTTNSFLSNNITPEVADEEVTPLSNPHGK